MPARLFYGAAQQAWSVPPFDGMTMSTELTRIGLAGLGGDHSSGWPEKSAVRYLRPGFVWLPAALIAGLGAWTLVPGDVNKPAKSAPVHLAAAVVAEPAHSWPIC